MKRKLYLALVWGSVLFIQSCGSIPSTEPDEDAAHKRANREEYAERIQDS